MELRHLRYFTAVVEAKGYRNASRRLYIAQPAVSQTVTDLEEELGLKLFVRKGLQVHLTAPGEVFYQEAKRTLAKAEAAVTAAKRAEKGQTGTLRIGFIPFATQHFLPELLRTYKQQNPGIELSIRELTPARQLEAFARGELDVAFTREVGSAHPAYVSRLLFHVPLVAILPESRRVKDGRIHIKDLAKDRFILLARDESPSLFDSIFSLCSDAGFSPKFDSHSHLAESMYMLVKAEEGIAILPAWARSFAMDGLQCVNLLPDTVQVELVLLQKRDEAYLVLRSFVQLLETELAGIRGKTALLR